MALKNLFDMVKADRYTADGREALIKAQEAETEDKVYQIGEISQKTGLQKTANGWVKPKNGKQPGAKKEEPKNVHGAEVDKIYERQLKRIKELKAKGFTDEQIDNDKIIKQTKEDMKNVGKKPESKPAEKHPPMVMPKGMSPAEFMKAWEDDAKKNGFKKGQGNEWREHLRKEEAESKPAAPRREAVSAGRMMKDLDGNFWSRPEDFKEDITSRGWDVDEMTNEYAVISNEAGSQYEVRFDDHSDDGDLTVRNFKALQIDEDDDDDSLEDSAPSLSEIVDRVYNIGEISEKTGLQKTAQGWRPVKKGAAGKTSRANKEEAIRKDLGLTAGEDMSRFSDEQIEKMYAKTQQTPEQQKADFDKSKIGQAVNKGRQEFAAEKTRQKELASKTNAIGLPKENKPALSQTDGKGNKVEIKITESKGGGFYVDKYVNGKKVGINNANTRESAEAKAKSMMEQHMADPDYKAESKPENKPKVPSSDDLDWAKGVASRNNVKAEDLIKNGTALKPGIKVSFNTPRDGDLSGEIIDIAGYDGKAFVTVSTPKGNRTIATEKVVTDSAPRVLTGDCRIRIRKEKPALTGDTKIRVRK